MTSQTNDRMTGQYDLTKLTATDDDTVHNATTTKNQPNYKTTYRQLAPGQLNTIRRKIQSRKDN